MNEYHQLLTILNDPRQGPNSDAFARQLFDTQRRVQMNNILQRAMRSRTELIKQLQTNIDNTPGAHMYGDTLNDDFDDFDDHTEFRPTKGERKSTSLRKFEQLEAETARRDEELTKSYRDQIARFRRDLAKVTKRPEDTFPNGAIILAVKDTSEDDQRNRDNGYPTLGDRAVKAFTKSDEGVWFGPLARDPYTQQHIQSWSDVLKNLQDFRSLGWTLHLVDRMYELPEGPFTKVPVEPTNAPVKPAPARKAAAKRPAKKVAVRRTKTK